MGDQSSSNRWLSSAHRAPSSYDEHFDRLRESGINVHGEADFVGSFTPTSVLDAGCGTGRVAIELAQRGYEVVGVDLDGEMIEIARRKAPDLRFLEGELSELELGRTFDLIVMAGNVMIFVAPGSEGEVLANMARHLSPGGLLVAGFSLAPDGLDVETYHQLCARADLWPVEQWSTWQRDPYEASRGYALVVHRRAEAA